jgi:hypothetical protein
MVGQYNFNVDVGSTTLRVMPDEAMQPREEEIWVAARARIYAMMERLSASFDFRALRDLLLAASAPEFDDMVLDLPAFVRRVRDERAKT